MGAPSGGRVLRPLGALIAAASFCIVLGGLAWFTTAYGARAGFGLAVAVALPLVWLDERRRGRGQ